MKNRNTFKFLLAAALIGGSFATEAMEADKKQLGEKLCEAAEKGNLDELNRLIKAGADVNHKNYTSMTPLIKASLQGHLECVRALLNAQANPNILWEFGKHTALMFATEKGLHEIVDLLIKSNADLNIQDRNGYTALMHACTANNPKCLRLLIAAQANLELQDGLGHTALILATCGGYYECTQLLISAHANIYTLDYSKRDALTYAVECSKEECINLLIEAGADLRPTARSIIWNVNSALPLILKSITVAHTHKNNGKINALLWCMKQLALATTCDQDFGLLVVKPLFAAHCAHKEMLEEAIEMLPNEKTKSELRWALYADQNNDESI